MADPSTPQSMVGTPASSVGDSGGGLDHDTAMKIINLLQRSGYKNAEDALRRDMSLGSVESGSRPVSAMAVPDTPAPELASYETLKEDPSNYTIQYEALLHMVNNCLDRFKPELGCLLWPVFAHMYLELLGGGFVQAAHTFVDKFGSVQEDYYQTSIKTMLRINSKEAINSSDLLQALKDNLFCIRISRDHLSVLSPFVKQYRIIMEIMRSRMTVETMDSAPRPADVVSALKGGWLGESARSANKTKVHYGVIKEDFSSSISAESMLSAEGEEAKKKKNRSRDSGKDKSSKKDVNAPNPGRIPLPEWSDRMKQDRALAAREAQKMTKYGPDKHPSVCFYTILNAVEGASACTFSDDSTNVAAGFGDSSICVWSLNDKLSRVKPWNLLQSLDKEGEGDDVEQQMLETTNQDSIIFRGHHGPVYALSFSPDKRLLLSASEDSTVRLWSLQTWTNLCVYKGGGYPLWDVNFCNRGYYFVTGSADRMATLWSTDRLQPLRIFSGHLSDVNGAVQSVSCSSDGKYIASGGSDGRAIVWDIGMGKMLAPSDVRDDEQNTSIYSLAFSRDNNLLAFGGSNHAVRVLYLPSVTSDPDELEANPADPSLLHSCKLGKRPFTESLLVCNKIFPSTRSSLHEVKFVNGRLYRPFGASQAETNGGEEHLVPLSLSRDNMSGMSLPSYSNDVTSPEMEIAGEIVGGNFFADSKSRHADLKAMLDSSKDGLKMEAMKRIINMVAKGKDASELFPAVVKNVAVKNLEVKKLVYVYLVRYAEEQQDLALLSISTFQRALKDPNQLIRSSALRVLSSIRVPMIVPIMMLAIKESMRDMSSFVRKTAAHAIPKLYSLDPEQRDQLIEVIDHLLADRTTLVVGSAVYAFEEVCPERTDLIHKHYRKLCQLLVDVDEWGQVTIINMLTRYARTQFTDPNQYVEEVKSDKESEEDDSGSDDVTAIRKQMDPDLRMLIQNTKSLLNSRNAAVVVAVAQMYYHLAPRSEMGVIAKALIRLLRSHREVQSVVLSNIATISAKRSVHEQYAISKNMFDPFLKSFFVRNSDPTHIKLLKLEVLTNLANQTNISIILRELQTYVRTHDQELAASAIDAIGRCAANIQEVTDACLSGLVSLMSSKNATVVAQSVVVIKRLLQLQPESHHDIIRSMAKLVDTVKVPAARASIIWLIGEYCEHVPTVAPDVLRKMAKTFVQEDETVKQQVLNLSVKLLLTNPDQTQLLTQYVFSLARYDQSYDLRDRARFLKAIAMPSKHTHLSKKAKQIFLSTKPAPVIESTFKDRDQYQLGTLSHYLNQRCNGYNDLPEFPEQPPDPTVRNVAGWGLPEATKDKKMDLLRQKIKKGFYSDQEDETAEDEEEDEEESGESGSGSSEEDEEESESSEETSSSEEEVPKPKPPPPSKSKKQTKKEQPTGNTDLLLDIDFGGPTSNLSVPALAPAVAPLVPSSGSPSKQSYSKTYSESWMTAPPQVVPSKTYELLNKVSGSGLCVQYRFPRAANLYSSTICSVELQAENHSKTVIEDLNIVQKPGCGIKVEGLNSFEAVLGVGASVSHRLGIGYGDTTQPCLLELTATVDGRARKYSLTVEAPVGEQLVPILLSPEQFKGLRARLSGMNETSGKIHLGNSEKQEFVQKIYNLANVIEVTCVEDLCFSAQTLSTQSPVLIALSPFSSGIETKLTVNCDKMVVGSMLFKALKLALAN